MNIAVVTLFEKEYYKGVFGLINSLNRYDFSGKIYIGYPEHDMDNFNKIDWGSDKLNINDLNGVNYSQNIQLIFYPIKNVAFHLTNYKPFFLKQIFESDSTIDALFYFDPDIVVNYSWHWYEMWINQGITIVHEIILNDMPSSHPLRILWKKIIYQNQLGNIEHEINSYCNAGFLGLQRSQIAFLDKWIEILNIATSKYDMNMQTFINGPREKPFRALDQDAFNIALMCTSETISEMGPEAMGFANNGLQVMLHATGSPKPWNKKFILNAIKGLPPTTADRGFVSNSNGGLNNYSSFTLKLKKLALNISIFICRFYKKN